MSSRRVFVCCGCGLLADSLRSDVITCSPACRVRAHRNGSAEALRRLAARFDIRPGLLSEARAVIWLRPDLESRIAAGGLKIEDCRTEVFAAFNAAVTRAVLRRGAEAGK
jgi:hypothetical protein